MHAWPHECVAPHLPDTAAEELAIEECSKLANVCSLLFASEWGGEHVAALAAAPAVQTALLRLLLEHVLPAW